MNVTDVIGSYPLSNNTAVLVHEIRCGIDDEVLASLNGKYPQWCKVSAIDENDTLGFCFGAIKVPLSEVMRV